MVQSEVSTKAKAPFMLNRGREERQDYPTSLLQRVGQAGEKILIELHLPKIGSRLHSASFTGEPPLMERSGEMGSQERRGVEWTKRPLSPQAMCERRRVRAAPPQ